MRACLGVTEEDQLIVAARPEQRELAVALTDAGYRAGARYVEVVYIDPRVQAARIGSAREEDLGPFAPWTRKLLQAMLEPTTATVEMLPAQEPGVFDGLARDLLWFCRLGPHDPPGFEGWRRHTTRIADRARALTELELTRLELRDRGTSLDFALAAGTRWLGGERENTYGYLTSPNFPTEESFTTPQARSTSGTFRSSRPLVFRGRTIDEIAGEFKGGRLVRLEASSEPDRDFLAAALDADLGARRLGEVALVDRSSRIGQAGRLYFETLLDENAAAHIAFGSGYGQTRLPDESIRGARGVNRSSLHIDVVIGTDELEATGVTATGRRVPLIIEGEWRL